MRVYYVLYTRFFYLVDLVLSDAKKEYYVVSGDFK